MEVNEDLNTVSAGPGDGLIKQAQLSLHVWLSVQGSDGPVANRNPHMVQAGGSDLSKVVLGDPAVPMGGQPAQCLIFPKDWSQGVFINSTIACLLEDRGCDPRFQHKPATKVHSADLLIVVVERSMPEIT